MNILLIGSSATEHAMAFKMQQSHQCNTLFIAPGNIGTATIGTNVALDINSFDAIISFCNDNKIALLVDTEGATLEMYDLFAQYQLIVIAPSPQALQLQTNQLFAKSFMQSNNISTQNYGKTSQITSNETIDICVVINAKNYQIIGSCSTKNNTLQSITNTAPISFLNESLLAAINNNIIKSTILGLQNQSCSYTGFLNFSIDIANNTPTLLQYSCNIINAQIVLARLETDIVSLFAAMDNGTLEDVNIEYNEGYFASIVASNCQNNITNNLQDIALPKNVLISHNNTTTLAVTTQDATILGALTTCQSILEMIVEN
jgi:phosphoribosylamine-glycine ligase